MRCEIAGDDADRTFVAKLARGAQHVEFGVDIQAVAGLDLDRRNTFGNERVEPWQSAFHERVD